MQSSFVIFHLLAHLLFLVSHSFQSEVPGSGKVIAWTSSALFAYFRDITCPSSLFTLPPEQRIIYEAILLHSPALNRNISCRQHLPLLRVLYKGRCVPTASLFRCSPVLFLLYWQQMTAAFGGFGWCERGGDTHLPSLPATACPSLWLCISPAVVLSCSLSGGLRGVGTVTSTSWVSGIFLQELCSQVHRCVIGHFSACRF